MVAYPGLISEEIPCRHKATHPEKTARYVEKKEHARAHERNPRHKGGKSAYDGNESGQNNGLAAVFFIKGIGPQQMFFLDEARLA